MVLGTHGYMPIYVVQKMTGVAHTTHSPGESYQDKIDACKITNTKRKACMRQRPLGHIGFATVMKSKPHWQIGDPPVLHAQGMQRHHPSSLLAVAAAVLQLCPWQLQLQRLPHCCVHRL